MSKDLAASVKARLMKISKKEARAFNTISLLYMQERLLYRLSLSKYKNRFILKGGLLLFSMNNFKGRPTRDIDFLADDISNELENIRETFIGICGIQCDDGITYDIDGITVERIKEDAEYEGVRVKLKSFLGKASETVQIDIGFGDIVIPNPVEMTFPTLLESEMPQIMAYSKESIIAEKFQAMVSLNVYNSRMKDFYDIYDMITKDEFEYNNLVNAIKETFSKRKTDISIYSSIFTSEFINNTERNRMWNNFLKRIGVTKKLVYSDVMGILDKFLSPVCKGIIDNKVQNSIWDYNNLEWK